MAEVSPSVVYTIIFILAWFFRYVRLLVNIVAFMTFKARTGRKKPMYHPENVTFLMPTTFFNPEEVVNCLKRIQSCGPAAIIVVTSFEKVMQVREHCLYVGLENIAVLGVSKMNKRRQMLKGLASVNTDITFFVDDDVYYPSTNLPQHLLNCFEDSKVGAAGPRMRAHRNCRPSIWNFLGICYLERRNFNTGATNHIDGGISTLSGRTQAVRTSILQNKEFFHYFRNDSFLGRKLTVDDDKALTRFIYSRGWDIALNFHDECTLETTLDEGTGFLKQCTRWARGHWRGNLIVMAKEKYWFQKHLWTLYAVYISQFQTPALLVDGFLFWLLVKAVQHLDTDSQWSIFSLFAGWILFSKIVKIMPHFLRHPQDLIFVPVSIIFSYLHGFINLYALFTTHKTIWGSKATGAESACPEDDEYPDHLLDYAARPREVPLIEVGLTKEA